MKKIVIINHYGSTPDLPGPTRHYEMADYFSKNTDKQVELWVCGYNHQTGKHHESLKGNKLQSIKNIKKFILTRIRSFPYRKKNSILRQLNISIFDFITAMKILFSRDIELIILSVPPISILNVLAIKFRKIKLVADVEDLWPLFLTEMGMKNKIATSYMNSSSRYLYNNADAVEAVSDGMLNYVKDQIKDKNKTMWLSPLGINEELFLNDEIDRNLINNKVWKDDFKIMYIGAHNPANDLYFVLNTVKTINESNKHSLDGRRLSFIFFGDGGEKEQLKDYKDELGLHNVYFEDAVPSYLVQEYLKHADVCLTNLKKIESFKLVRPNKIFQYMALSKPIICGIWGEAKDIIEENNAGVYVDFTKPEDASRKIISYINNSTKMLVSGENGLTYIKKYGIRANIFKEFLEKINAITRGEL